MILVLFHILFNLLDIYFSKYFGNQTIVGGLIKALPAITLAFTSFQAFVDSKAVYSLMFAIALVFCSLGDFFLYLEKLTCCFLGPRRPNPSEKGCCVVLVGPKGESTRKGVVLSDPSLTNMIWFHGPRRANTKYETSLEHNC